MDKTLICKKNRPKAVYELNNVHYFYWPFEIGFGWFKVWKLKIPSFPIKFFDYEPIKVNKKNTTISISTRFHYRIFVYFNKLKLSDDKKPIIDFSLGSHSPIALTDLNNAKIGNFCNFEGMQYMEREAFIALFTMYTKILDGTLKPKTCELQEYTLDEGNVPEDLIFNPENLSALIFLGNLPTKEELNHAGFQV